jgi:hypothetical protein
MLRHAITLAALLSPVVVIGAQQGCGDEPLPQDICSWLADGNNCYTRFANDVGTQCGTEFVAGNDPLASATGSFAVREELETCVRFKGGLVKFDPPLDLAAFPLQSVSFKMLDKKAGDCGAGSFSNELNYSVTIAPVDRFDAGGSAPPDGGPLADHITGGTFTASSPDGRQTFDVSCPGGTESHNFNLLVLKKCQQYEPFLPHAVLDSSPGVPELTGSDPPQIAQPGFVRLRVVYPPTDPLAPGATTRVVEYFNCLIPPPPAPCKDGVRNGDETDVDCGGSCPSTCAEGQGCNVGTDCSSGVCGFNGGIQQCLAG